MAKRIISNKTRKREVNKKNKGRLFLVLVFSFVLLSFLTYRLSRFTRDTVSTTSQTEQEITDSELQTGNSELRTPNSELQTPTSEVIDITKLSSREQLSHFAEIFGILPRLLRSTSRGGQIEVQMPVNFSAVDLNYTNFRLTQYLTSLNWRQISGIESANQNQQVLTFLAPDELIYSIRLSYDRTGAYPEIRPKVAIVVKGFGRMNQNDLDRWLQLETNICYSVLPINRTSRMNIQQIINHNFEALIEIPLEDTGHPVIPSPDYAIFGDFRDNEVVRRMDRFFSLLPGARGTITHRGGLITTDRRIMPIILNYINDRNLYFIDDKAIETSIAFNLAQQMVMTSYEKSITFYPRDYQNDTNNQRLSADFRRVNRNPMIVTLQNPDDETFDFLQKLLTVINESGFQLVRVSEL